MVSVKIGPDDLVTTCVSSKTSDLEIPFPRPVRKIFVIQDVSYVTFQEFHMV